MSVSETGRLKQARSRPDQQLRLIPGNAPAIFLDDHEPIWLLDPLVGGEPLNAIKAFSPPADRPPFIATARIDDLQALLLGVAVGTAHGPLKIPTSPHKGKKRDSACGSREEAQFPRDESSATLPRLPSPEDQPKRISPMIDRIFKAYDVRATYPNPLNEEMAWKVGHATGAVSQAQPAECPRRSEGQG